MYPARIGDLNTVFARVISLALALVALAFLAMLISGGFQYLTAGGEKEAVKKAQGTITNALTGLFVALCAWMIINFVGSVLGIDFSFFNICLPGFLGSNCL